MISLLYIATTKRKHKGNGIQVIHLSAQKRQENKTLHCTDEEIKDVISLSCEGTAVALGASSIKSLHLQSKTKNQGYWNLFFLFFWELKIPYKTI